jgi:hypothetical protein
VPPGAGEEDSEAEREDRSGRVRGEDRRADGRRSGRLLGGGDLANVDVVEHGRVRGQVEAAHAPRGDEDGGELSERAAGELLEAVPIVPARKTSRPSAKTGADGCGGKTKERTGAREAPAWARFFFSYFVFLNQEINGEIYL